MVINISFGETDLVRLDQIISQLIRYADGHTDAVGGITEDDISDIRTNAYNFRQNHLMPWLLRFAAFDGGSYNADYS